MFDVCDVEFSQRCECMTIIFFFKQKTAYEMRISDWSSDVCSSDLSHDVRVPAENLVGEPDSGWQQARFLLGNERTHNAYVGMLKRHLLRIAKLIEAAPARGVTPFAQAQYRRAHALLEIDVDALERSEEHTSELPSLMRIANADF